MDGWKGVLRNRPGEPGRTSFSLTRKVEEKRGPGRSRTCCRPSERPGVTVGQAREGKRREDSGGPAWCGGPRSNHSRRCGAYGVGSVAWSGGAVVHALQGWEAVLSCWFLAVNPRRQTRDPGFSTRISGKPGRRCWPGKQASGIVRGAPQPGQSPFQVVRAEHGVER